MPRMIRKLFGLAPIMDENQGFSPSPVALKLASKSKTDYDHSVYDNPYQGGKRRILMVCTEERYMTMKNGERFSTGNHPVEMLVPLLHLEQAGFAVDIYTPTAESAKVEMWAMPREDEAVLGVYEKYKSQLEKPGSLKELVQNGLDKASDYVAVFIPGGHGAMLGLPENEDLNEVLHWSFENDKFIFSICHGPAALLAADRGAGKESFLFNGYEMAVFPDSMDKITPLLGYMPGSMPWYFGEKLQSLGVKIINKKANGSCHRDRNLISGDSPDAANPFGKMAAEALLSKFN